MRRYVVSDASAMFVNWSADEDVTKFLMWAPHVSEEISRKVIEEWETQYADKTFIKVLLQKRLKR